MNSTRHIQPQAVTVEHNFFNATGTDQPLFSVRAGIPLEDAFNQLSVLISDATAVLEDLSTVTELGDKPQSRWAALHLLEFADGLTQSIHLGHSAFEKETSRNIGP